MLLVDVRNYLSQQGRVSLRDLVWHFHVEPDAMRGMLDHWIRKGKVMREPNSKPCGTGCCACEPELTEFYLWNG
jgi:hypothetical protein